MTFLIPVTEALMGEGTYFGSRFPGISVHQGTETWCQEWLSLCWEEHVTEQLFKQEIKEWDQKSVQARMLKGLPVVTHFLQSDPTS